jgi:hypothetical protein
MHVFRYFFFCFRNVGKWQWCTDLGQDVLFGFRAQRKKDAYRFSDRHIFAFFETDVKRFSEAICSEMICTIFRASWDGPGLNKSFVFPQQKKIIHIKIWHPYILLLNVAVVYEVLAHITMLAWISILIIRTDSIILKYVGLRTELTDAIVRIFVIVMLLSKFHV